MTPSTETSINGNMDETAGFGASPLKATSSERNKV